MRNKSKAMRKLMEELKIPFFTPSEEQYMKEYIEVMKPIVQELDIFQGEKNIGLGYLLPTITILKSDLFLLQGDSNIVHCHSLISGLVNVINLK
jgi:hypothetical protein